MAGLRRGLELGYRQAQQAASDYSPTLGEMAKEPRVVGQRLVAMEGYPVLRLTPGELTHQIAAGVRQANEDATKGHANAGARRSAPWERRTPGRAGTPSG